MLTALTYSYLLSLGNPIWWRSDVMWTFSILIPVEAVLELYVSAFK